MNVLYLGNVKYLDYPDGSIIRIHQVGGLWLWLI